jgi:hypothetical protein
LSLWVTVGIIAMFAMPARRRVTGIGRELDAMLVEGQGGFVDMMRGAMARRG